MRKQKQRNRNLSKEKYELVAKRDGDKCYICGVPRSEVKRLELHHSDEDKTNDRDENLFLCCPSCHRQLHPRGKDKRKRKQRPIDTNAASNVGEFTRMSPQMMISRKKYPEYKRWLLAEIKEHGRIRVDYAIYAGAEENGVMSETVRNSWLKQCTTSTKSAFQIVYDESADCNFVTFRNAITNGKDRGDGVGPL